MNFLLRTIWIISYILLCPGLWDSRELYAQNPVASMGFESIEEIVAMGGISVGTPEVVPGVIGNGVSLSNATSICFPAAPLLQAVRGTLQFWIQNPAPGGIWEVTNVGVNKHWGAFREVTTAADDLHYELQTNLGTFVRSSRHWAENSDWHLVVFTWQQGAVRTEYSLSLDSVAGGRPNLLGKVDLTASSELCIGTFGSLPSSHLAIDELKTFDYVRTTAEVFTEFLELLPGCPSWPYLWRNPSNGADVNHDGALTKLDVLYVLSALASQVTFDFNSCLDGVLSPLLYDVFADNHLDTQDVNAVFTAVNNGLPAAEKLDLAQLRLFTQGDVNQDGVLDGVDITYLREHFGSMAAPFEGGDITGDGIVNDQDLTVAHRNVSLAGDLSAVLPRFKVLRPLSYE